MHHLDAKCVALGRLCAGTALGYRGPRSRSWDGPSTAVPGKSTAVPRKSTWRYFSSTFGTFGTSVLLLKRHIHAIIHCIWRFSKSTPKYWKYEVLESTGKYWKSPGKVPPAVQISESTAVHGPKRKKYRQSRKKVPRLCRGTFVPRYTKPVYCMEGNSTQLPQEGRGQEKKEGGGYDDGGGDVNNDE